MTDFCVYPSLMSPAKRSSFSHAHMVCLLYRKIRLIVVFNSLNFIKHDCCLQLVSTWSEIHPLKKMFAIFWWKRAEGIHQYTKTLHYFFRDSIAKAKMSMKKHLVSLYQFCCLFALVTSLSVQSVAVIPQCFFASSLAVLSPWALLLLASYGLCSASDEPGVWRPKQSTVLLLTLLLLLVKSW